MQDFLDNYCTCEIEENARSKHMIDKHVNDILTKILQPVFKKQAQIHPTLSRRPEPKYRAAHESELHEDQLWKNHYYTDILAWILQEISTKDLEENLHLIFPPVLIVLDDYDIVYKEQGVKMVHDIINKLKPEYLSRFGLDNVFLESLFKCLLYLSDDRNIPLLKATYPCIMDLIATTKNDRVRSDLYERVLRDGIMTGHTHAGQKIKFLPVLLQPISTLYNELGVIGAQYLKAIIPILCDAMAMISSTNQKIREINQLAAESLATVLKKCWPRIPAYKGAIMRALAKSWSYYHSINDEAMCDMLKNTYQVFEAACQGQEKVDKEALLKYNKSIYGPLFTV